MSIHLQNAFFDEVAYQRMQNAHMAAMQNAAMGGGLGMGLQRAGIGSTSSRPEAEKTETLILLTVEEI